MVSTEEHAQVVAERDDWKALAQDRLVALEKLKADRSAETIRTAGRLAQFAWILMLVMVVFAAVIIVTGAIRATARECPPMLERP